MKTSLSVRFQVLHEQALKVAQTYLGSERQLIILLQEVDLMQGYRELEYKTLHDYAVGALHLSDGTAYTLIKLARVSHTLPEFHEKIQSQAIDLTSARMIAPLLTEQNQGEWMERAARLSKRGLEREIQREFPEKGGAAMSGGMEKARFVTESRLELKLGVSEALHGQLKRVQDLVSQKRRLSASLEDTLQALVDSYLERHDPVQKAERSELRRAGGPGVLERSELQKARGLNRKEPRSSNRVPVVNLLPVANMEFQGTSDAEKGREQPPKEKPEEKNSEGLAEQSFSPKPRRALPASLKHAVHLRDRGQCTEQDVQTAARCEDRRWIDLHHVVEVSRGGLDTVENLRTLCHAHHRMIHLKC